MGAAWLMLILESLPSCPMILPSLSIKNENIYQQKALRFKNSGHAVTLSLEF